MKRMNLADKLALDKFAVNEGKPHIVINNVLCRSCQNQPCLYVCPAGLYTTQNGEIIVEWAGCLECGTCKVACSLEALEWEYPEGGFGIIYRQG